MDEIIAGYRSFTGIPLAASAGPNGFMQAKDRYNLTLDGSQESARDDTSAARVQRSSSTRSCTRWVCGNRSISRHSVWHRGSYQCRDKEAVTSCCLGDENDGGERCFVGSRDKRGHLYGRIHAHRRAVHDRLRKGSPETAASEGDGHKHRAHPTRAQCCRCCCKLEDPERNQFSRTMAVTQHNVYSFIIRSERNQHSRIEAQVAAAKRKLRRNVEYLKTLKQRSWS